MIYFHYCEAYNRQVPAQVDRTLRKKLQEYSLRENLVGLNNVSSYSGGIFVLNLVNPHYKVILEEKRRDSSGEIVYFVRDIIPMGKNYNWSQTYIQVRDGKWHVYNPLPETEVEEFESIMLNQVQKPENKEAPPNHLTNWHLDYKLKVEYDIYETEQWVKFALSNSHSDGMKDDEAKMFRLTLQEIVSDEKQGISEVAKRLEGQDVKHLVLNEIGVLYSEIRVSDHPSVIYLLHSGANVTTQKEHWNRLLQEASTWNKVYNNLEDVQRVALRAYPRWTLNDTDLWKEIQKNSENGNLSLLPEQTNFLQNFTFPKYINGQAGSGKSTMLYYLFSNAYYYKCAGSIQGDILFITENEHLLKHTKESIIELLQCNTDFHLSFEQLESVEQHFISFKQFLIKIISSHSDDFREEKYLDFSKFKILYENSAIQNYVKRKYSAEFIWFALTTYIYGFDLDFQVTSENYNDKMPSEGRELLSIDDLRSIERDVLPFYKRLIADEKYWDKITAIKYIVSNLKIDKEYEVIFCDEAQDFSRVELRFILGLSEYVKYNLEDTSQVPIVFAGDALQTVNPTGFRSAEVKDMLYDELKNIAGFKLNTDSIEYAPDFNYRSSQAIVNVANAVQYHRKRLFNANIKRPQKPKRPEVGIDPHLNVFLDYETVDGNIEIYKKLKYKIFIIPTNSDEKEDYIEAHPILKEFDNVKTAVEAKGIDYDQVVIFGFGEYFLNIPPQENYKSRFFYNKLYVAITRAQYELVIIDSKNSEIDFWKEIIDSYASSSWAEESDVEAEKIKDIIVFGAGQVVNIKDSTPEMAHDNALKDKNQGIFNNNPFLLRIAANQFLRLGDKKEHFLCLALMSALEEKWEQAANYFLRKEVDGGINMAADAYWKGQLLDKLINLKIHSPTIKNQIQFIIADVLTNNKLIFSDISRLLSYKSDFRKLLQETPWRSSIIDKLLDFLVLSTDDEIIRGLFDIFDEIATNKDQNVWNIIGIKSYEVGKYEYSIDAFEKINVENIYYINAKIEISRKLEASDETVYWLWRLAENSTNINEQRSAYNDIIKTFLKNKQEIYNKSNRLIYSILYASFLLVDYNSEMIIELSKKVEHLYQEENGKVELVDFYIKLIINKSTLPRFVVDFIIVRWAKNRYELDKNVDSLNAAYKELALSIGINYHSFTKEELNSIPISPDFTIGKIPDHISGIYINNFRSLKNIKVENVGLTNLVVGDNNVGKTSFLEALLFTPDKKEYIDRLAYAYIQRRNINPDKEVTSEKTKVFYKIDSSFLKEFQNYDTDKLELDFILEYKRSSWAFKVVSNSDINNIKDISYQYINYEVMDYASLMNLSFIDSIKNPIIPYGKGWSFELASAYHKEVELKPKVEESFLKNMELFIPSIKRIKADTDKGVIRILDENRPDIYNPIHQYGDGANKLFRILVSLAIHKGKKILIDEIDAGIHHSRFLNFWKILLTIAHRDQTQIIATTHNEECIKYYIMALEELGTVYMEKSRVLQLKNVSNELKIRSYEFESFNLAITQHFELRGGDII